MAQGRPILDLKRHGASGYRRGCGCPTCRAGHAKAAADYRARKRREQERAELEERAEAQAVADTIRPVDESQAPLLLDPTLEAGPVELAFVDEVAAIVGEPPWKGTLAALGRANARIVDQVHRHQRLDVLSGVQLRFMDILDRLRRTPGGSGGEGVPADLGSLLGEPD